MFSHHRDTTLGRAAEYASDKDFCRVFHQDMNVLYWLALMLTADQGKAEQCFVAGLDECIEGNSVFKDWARSWSRRVVIKNAIRLVSPAPRATNDVPAIPVQEEAGSQDETVLAVLACLRPFDRFVFVMSVLEGYADHDCATLLECSPSDVVNARLRALDNVRRALEHSPVLKESHGKAMVLDDVEVA